jgi:multidrug efflux pump subunit AcrA (membrane-fusion protein)
MNNMKAQNFLSFGAALLFIFSCHSTTQVEEETETEVHTPVTVTTINNSPLSEYAELNATSAFLQKSYIKASSNGYLQAVNTQLGQYVNKGKIVFTTITKEARAIGNTINALDPNFKFTGITNIRANENGYVSEINHQKGDYVQDGEQLAVINNASSFVFVLYLPYEFRQAARNNPSVEVTLPDGEILPGSISSAMPTVDSTSQTQKLIIRVNAKHTVPENLIAKVRLLKMQHSNTTSLPKGAVLANETQDEFWVMKLINDSVAVKVPVKKGIESAGQVEILSPGFNPQDRIILTGNYGLADTAKVIIRH